MDINTYYKFLNVNPSASDEEVSAAYKKLAFQFHPDKNPHRAEWANDAMTKLNIAYSTVMTYRFNDESTVETGNKKTEKRQEPTPTPRKPHKDIIDSEILTKQFINLRETAKDALYRYFQYSLYNIPIREKVANRAVFNKIVFSLRKNYHAIRRLKDKTEDDELIEHFDVFTAMLFHFYRASECLNIIDSYSNQYDVESYRIYRKGDDCLTDAGKEIFYDRHNRGHFKKELAYTYVREAEKIFQANLTIFPDSTWAVETSIKLDYARSLKKYIELFFSES
ncbi:MAG TPA: J domain-containing protein [Spirochaetota bacterium]|nr:J domain-containing protein [Spirochaetota bacterium]HPC42880.1 J domain-containing protein [Spirochaetota bacterium]HPL17115.1 J domain-containing protein [Spirochaetota bacterium]HQF10339.1 J domain-containing protein [Spirochaetota bacterium]HQH99196.1 J domain-containing protein [Spirochaetota bacterium]